MKNYKLFFVIAMMLVSLQMSFAQDKEFKPEIKIGGTLFTGWQFNVDNADFINQVDPSSPDATQPFGYTPTKNQFETSKSSFYLERAYINLNATITPQIKARFTPDIYQAADNTGKTQYFYQVKFAWAEYTPLIDDNGMSLSFQVGLVPNTWVPVIEKYFGYRGMIKTLTDYTFINSATVNTTSGVVTRNTGSYFSTADLGATTHFSFPQKYADLYVSILNGNGFRDQSFDNRFKDVMVAGFVYPLAGELKKKTEEAKKSGKSRISGISDLTVGGFAYIGKLNKGEYGVANGGQYQNNRFGGMFNFKYNFNNAGFVKLTGEVAAQSNKVPNTITADSSYTAMGFAGYIEFCPPIESFKDRLSLVGVYYNFNPNSSADYSPAYALGGNNAKQSVIGIGLFYKPADVLKIGVNYQMVKFDNNVVVKYDGTPTDKINRIFLNAILDF